VDAENYHIGGLGEYGATGSAVPDEAACRAGAL